MSRPQLFGFFCGLVSASLCLHSQVVWLPQEASAICPGLPPALLLFEAWSTLAPFLWGPATNFLFSAQKYLSRGIPLEPLKHRFLGMIFKVH